MKAYVNVLFSCAYRLQLLQSPVWLPHLSVTSSLQICITLQKFPQKIFHLNGDNQTEVKFSHQFPTFWGSFKRFCRAEGATHSQILTDFTTLLLIVPLVFMDNSIYHTISLPHTSHLLFGAFSQANSSFTRNRCNWEFYWGNCR